MILSRDPDALVGASVATGGAAGLTLQTVMQWGSALALFLNIVAILAGLGLTYLRLKKAQRESKEE